MREKMKQPAMVVAVVAVFLSVTGGAVAAKLITGKQIKNGSITAADIKPGTVSKKRLAKGVQDALNRVGTSGTNGTNGTAGPTGPTGPKGVAGPTGAKGDVGPTGAKGDMGPTGQTGQTGQTGAAIGDAKAEYGVVKVFVDGTSVGTLWTPDVPDDGNNAAVVSGSTTAALTGGGIHTVTLRGVMRSAEADGGQIGAGIIVRSADGTIIGGGQTDESTDFPGIDVENVDAVPLTSGRPDATDTVIVTATVTASGTISVEGTVQAFDFND